MNVLVVVDMQNDFIDGSLGTKEAEAIVLKVAETIREFEGPVIATRDTHSKEYLSSAEGQRLPVVHCVKGTEGWNICGDVMQAMEEKTEHKVIDKVTFGSVELGQCLRKMDEEETVEEIILVELCTDICVISNALLLKAYLPETDIKVVASCCAGITPESHERALEAMQVCQIEIV